MDANAIAFITDAEAKRLKNKIAKNQPGAKNSIRFKNTFHSLGKEYSKEYGYEIQRTTNEEEARPPIEEGRPTEDEIVDVLTPPVTK